MANFSQGGLIGGVLGEEVFQYYRGFQIVCVPEVNAEFCEVVYVSVHEVGGWVLVAIYWVTLYCYPVNPHYTNICQYGTLFTVILGTVKNQSCMVSVDMVQVHHEI